MNRIIKFRLIYLNLNNKSFKTEVYSLESLLKGEHQDSEMFYSPTWFLRSEKLQFTGLLDKNGVEIYEGDIVEYGRAKNQISFIQKLAIYDDLFGLGFATMASECKVIGNIYENPELLKEPTT